MAISEEQRQMSICTTHYNMASKTKCVCFTDMSVVKVCFIKFAKRRVRQQPQTVEQLKLCIQQEWAQITPAKLQHLVIW